MKHIITILLIGFSLIAESQDYKEILKGEWLVSPKSDYATYTQTWNFISDSILVITRGDNTQEKYRYLIRFSQLLMHPDTNHLDDESPNTHHLSFERYTENSLRVFRYPRNDINDTVYIQMIFTKKSIVDLTQKAISINKSMFSNKVYQITSSKTSLPWHNQLIIEKGRTSVMFLNDTCIAAKEFSIVNTPNVSIITFDEIGTIQIIEKQDSSWIKGIVLNDKTDTITFQLIPTRNNNTIKKLAPLHLTGIRKEQIKDYLSGSPILFVGMTAISFFENGKGLIKDNGDEHEISWSLHYDNILRYTYEYTMEEFSSHIVLVDVYLKLEFFPNDRIIGTSIDCYQDKVHYVEK